MNWGEIATASASALFVVVVLVSAFKFHVKEKRSDANASPLPVAGADDVVAEEARRVAQYQRDMSIFREFVKDRVVDACYEAGLNRDAITDEFDVASTGKLHDVLYYAAKNLSSDHPVKTVKDIVTVLSGAK